MQDWVKIAVALAVLAVLYRCYSRNQEGFVANITTSTPGPSVGTHISDAGHLPLTDALTGMPVPNGCAPPQSIDTDLLPKPCAPGDTDFSEFAPNPAALANQNYLEPAKFIGMDTTAGSLKNSNRDIRQQPPIPNCPGAWGNVYKSTIQPDPWRKSLADCYGTATSAR